MNLVIVLLYLPIIVTSFFIFVAQISERMQKHMALLNTVLILFIALYSCITLMCLNLSREQRTLSENLIIWTFYVLMLICLFAVILALVRFITCKKKKISYNHVKLRHLIALVVIVAALRIWGTFLAIDAGNFFYIYPR